VTTLSLRARQPTERDVAPSSGGPVYPLRTTLRWTRASRLPSWPGWAVALVTLWAFLETADTILAIRHEVTTSLCWFKAATGKPCPTCGMTRGLLYLGDGRLGAAFSMNPLLFTVLGAGGLLLAIRLASGRTLRLTLSRRGRWAAGVTVLIALALNWAYLVASGV